jgi:hypothetical protein
MVAKQAESVTIRPDGQGRLFVTFPYSEARVEQIKDIPGRRWLPDQKMWSMPDTPEARAALTEIFVAPPKPTGEWIGVAPPKPQKEAAPPPRAPFAGQAADNQPAASVNQGGRRRAGLARHGLRHAEELRPTSGNYVAWLKVEPEQAAVADIRGYLVQMANSEQASAGYRRQARAALVFLYETVLKQPAQVAELPRMKRPQQLPVVLPALAVRPGSREEIGRILRTTANLKHKALLVTAYSAGLRVGEVVLLKVSDFVWWNASSQTRLFK